MQRYRWVIWSVFLVGWTVALLRPVPAPAIDVVEQFAPGRRWFVAKGVHLFCYALLAILSGWLRVPVRFRPLLMLGIMAHCTATELGQLALTYREGSLIDVAIDNVGVLIGLAISWRLWREADHADEVPIP